MELLVVALEEAERAGKLPFLARGEGDVQRGGLEPVGQRRRGLQQERLALGPVRAIAHERRRPVTGVKGTAAWSFG